MDFAMESSDMDLLPMDLERDIPASPSPTTPEGILASNISSFVKEHETDTTSVSPIYQTRWTFACKHMFIHDDEDPLYPIRFGPPQLLRTSEELCPMCKEMGKSILPQTNDVVLRDDEKHLSALAAQKQEFNSRPPQTSRVVLRDDEKHLATVAARKDELSQQMRTLIKANQGRQARAVQDLYLQSSVAEARRLWNVERHNVHDSERGLYALRLNPRNITSTLFTKQRFVQDKLEHLGSVFFSASCHADSIAERAKFDVRRKVINDLRSELKVLGPTNWNTKIRGGMNEVARRETIITGVWDKFVKFMREQTEGNDERDISSFS
ncbi:hypothetical protein DL98DRAFT_523870 [Cadophora sp. DSE1049]|nr:hypothetical protein DL98DRAFT_523870 [Cadophora sp. DSE1049]